MLFLTLILRKYARSPCPTSISTAVLSAASTSKAAVAIHMRSPMPFMTTTTFSLTWKPRRYVLHIHIQQSPSDFSSQVYVLPDGYLVSDPSLEDIAFVLSPTFTPASIATLSTPVHLQKPSYDLANKPYIPGYIGLNNIKRNDYMNVVIHSLLHVPPLRDHLLLSNYRGKESELLKRFAGLAKKVWNPRLFKSQVSPHEFLQEVNRISAGKYSLEKQGDPVEFLGWLLNHLHKDMGGTKKKNSSESSTSGNCIPL